MKLSKSEQRVHQCTRAGESIKSTARLLNLSPETVKTHRRMARIKMGQPKGHGIQGIELKQKIEEAAELMSALRSLTIVVLKKNNQGADWGNLMGEALAALSKSKSAIEKYGGGN